MKTNKLLEKLRNLEVELHQQEVRSNVERLDALLHDSFFEFGRSGQSYNKTEIINLLSAENSSGSIWSQDFIVEEIADGISLLMYKSAYIQEDGELTQHTNRTSLWQLTDRGWQIRFHQGTPTCAFETNA